MPDIPRHLKTVTPKPVGRAPLPVGAADIGESAKAAGLGVLGRGVSDLGQTKLDIRLEQIKLNDAVNMTKANALIEAEDKTFAKLMRDTDPGIKGDGSPSGWEVEREKSWNKLTEDIGQLEFSGRASSIMQAKLDAYGELRDVNIRTAQSELKKTQAEAFVTANLQKAIQSGDPIRIADAKGLFLKSAPSIWGGDKATADALLKKAIEDGTKEFLTDQSKLRIDTDKFVEEMRKKQASLGKDGKDEAGLGAKDYDDIIASAYNAQDLRKKSLDVQQQKELDELGDALVAGTIDWSMIQSKESLTAEQRESYRLKMNAEAKRKASGAPIAVDQREKRRLEGMAYDLTNGSVTKPQFDRALDNARFPAKGEPSIDDGVYDELVSLAEGKFTSYQDKAMRERETHALGQLVTFPNEDTFEQQLARLTSKFEKQQMQTQRQLQFDNFDLYKIALRDWRKTNPDATANDITNEGRRMLREDGYRKTVNELKEERAPAISSPPPEKIEELSRSIQDTITGVLSGGQNFRKGPVNNPKFVLKDGKPEIVMKEGTEVGLKLQGGRVLKIGNQYRIGNKVYEYIGNGKATPVD